MNFKPTSTKSIVSSFGPLIISMMAFKFQYCTDCTAEVLKAQQQEYAIILLFSLFFILYIGWSIIEKPDELKDSAF